ncbi:MAG: sulfurtransferase TusA family protein [Candidatus Omnitrophica bacterium]|nr:sulfurtransferase TusA family protein [Candidatus Omnitrophota bacterium]
MNELKVNQHLDLKGVPCPLNFVKTKLMLEGMESGSILEVVLDDGEPITNVTASVKEEGHQILKVEKTSEYWKLTIKKV